MNKNDVAVVGVVCVTMIACVCVAKGIDGVIIGTACGAIGTIIGWVFGKGAK